MSPHETAERDAILARLAASRAEIQTLLEPPPASAEGPEPGGLSGEFPRSRLMRMLMSGRGLSTAGALVGGLLLARPTLLWRLLRALPTRAVGRLIVLRLLNAVMQRRSRA